VRGIYTVIKDDESKNKHKKILFERLGRGSCVFFGFPRESGWWASEWRDSGSRLAERIIIRNRLKIADKDAEGIWANCDASRKTSRLPSQSRTRLISTGGRYNDNIIHRNLKILDARGHLNFFHCSEVSVI